MSPPPPFGRGSSGFTLVEMLVVMVLLGLLSTIALPSLHRWQQALQARSEAALVIESLRAQAFRAGASQLELALKPESFLEKPAPGLVQVKLPQGWILRRMVPASFLPNGLCRPGLLAFTTSQGSHELLLIEGPICKFSWQKDLSMGSP